MPGVVYALIVIITSNFKTIWWCFIFILIFIPFPLFVWVLHIVRLFADDAETEALINLYLFLEAGLEACPQLLLQIFIILRETERDVSILQWITILTSSFTIVKATMENFAAAGDEDDSMLFDRGFIEKITILAKISPAFITSLVFKVRSKVDYFSLSLQYFRLVLSPYCALSFTGT